MTGEENMINHLKHLISLAQDSLEVILISYAHDRHPGILLMSVLFPLLKPVPLSTIAERREVYYNGYRRTAMVIEGISGDGKAPTSY
jgi:hypothetical protein